MTISRVLPLLLLSPHLLSAQIPDKPAASDSLQQVSSDSLRVATHSPLDSSATRSLAPAFHVPNIRLHTDTTSRFGHLLEDVWQLGANSLPLIPLRAGESGQPRYFATGALPARVLDSVVDEVLWRPGVYGTIDLSSLPGAAIDAIAQNQLLPVGHPIDNSAAYFDFTTDSLHFNMPFSRAEYAKGPFGAEESRVRFGRAFSQRVTGFINLTVSNADGFRDQNKEFVRIPYDGFKLGAKLDYRVNANWRARYRYFLSRHEAGIAAPFFPEEWQTGGGGRHKETRSYHALELARSHAFTTRLYLWRIGEELNDPAVKIRHDLHEAGAEAKWQWQRKNFAGSLVSRLGRENLESPTLDYDAKFFQHLHTHMAVRVNDRFWMQAFAEIRHKNDWPTGHALAANGIFAVNQNIHLWMGFEHRQIPPAIAERSNALAYFSRNSSLQAVTLQHAQTGLALQGKVVDLQFSFGSARWHDGYVLQTDRVDTTAFLQNSSEIVETPALQLRGSLRPFPGVAAGVIWAQAIQEVPQQFWFWHQPRSYARLHVESSWKWFDKDLEITPRFALRLLGERASPDLRALPESMQFTHFPAARMLDFQLRLRYGAGALFFAWENLLSEELQWRAGVHDLGRIFRWGFWWTFLN